ncbi:GNAT family N-acetyltransferase [Jiella avicenniae]|uniref:N-acetyltransferase n=1 Tax=Jiella avicenniae TaxID=2907202 RepID=A0A9X1P2Q2_9HYPH|nr:N-acetyltransferase [Jiella avicenniae]MCE7027627.1 N-acetyltransferase [Jiella avicenniae]MCE7028669.1 N-acetyltransferase [Jiella avicenniae]
METDPHVRPETPADHAVVRSLIEAAFRDAPHSDQTEAAIVDGLREASAMALSLVAVDEDGGILGHIAFSAVSVASGESGWYGLGPVAVWPQLQRRGIGTALVSDGLRRLKERGAKGCVLLGDPAFYSRFGFESDPALTYRGLPSEYVQRLVFIPPAPRGEITYHAAFEVAA